MTLYSLINVLFESGFSSIIINLLFQWSIRGGGGGGGGLALYSPGEPRPP